MKSIITSINMRITFLLVIFIGASLIAFSQEGQAGDAMNLSADQMDKPLTINLADNDEEEESTGPKKKRRKKNVFYGVKTKKNFVKSGSGERAIFETFRYLRDFEEPDPYVRDVYWYDYETKRIKKSKNINRKKGVILHGPYEKYRADGTIIEKGIYYKGMKHGRWTKHNSKNILIDKRKYYKGWPKESMVTYHDIERTKLKEVIPVEYGEKEGNYFLFHDNGMVAVAGEYQSNEKVNVWREFYKFRRRKKKEVQFRKKPFEKNANEFIIKEWNDKGDLIYDRNKYLKSIK